VESLRETPLNTEEQKQKARERTRRWQEKNREYSRRKVKEWRENNPELVREQWKRQSERRSAKGPRVRNTTTPCIRCGVLDRMPSGSCKPCTIRRNEERKQKYPERVRELANARVQRYRDRMPKEKKIAKGRQGNLAKVLKLHGLTHEQHATMVEAQDNRCAICGASPGGRFKHLAIDHCHATGKVRGLLCTTCNLTIGGFKDDVARFRAAIAYIETHKEPVP
jgi:hypothetical protein